MKFYKFSPEQEKKIFNLILKRTLDKTIHWCQGIAMLRGQAKSNLLLFYIGEKVAISIQNRREYMHFYINQEQAKILKNIINGKFKKSLGFDAQEIANDFYECPIDVQYPVNELEQISESFDIAQVG